jgi:hypothetical protein
MGEEPVSLETDQTCKKNRTAARSDRYSMLLGWRQFQKSGYKMRNARLSQFRDA